MGAKNIEEANNPVLRGSLAAIRRAAKSAREQAARTNTALIVAHGGKLTRIYPGHVKDEEGAYSENRGSDKDSKFNHDER